MQAPLPDDIAERVGRVEHRLTAGGRTVDLAARMALLCVPGVSVAVINGGRIEWAKGYGVEDTGTAETVTPETIFQAASISKPVAAVAALRLVEAGALDLDEDVNAYLRTWRVRGKASGDDWEPRVTIRQLLCHGAGLTAHGFLGYRRDQASPSLHALLDGVTSANSAAIRVDTIPGTQFRYSGGGYCVLQQALVDITGKIFPVLMHELVLDPLGMERSTYEQPLPAERWADAATGHRSDGGKVEGNWHVYPEMAAAGLWTTPSDLARFAIAIQRARAGESSAFLSPAMATALLTPQVEPFIGLGIFLQGAGPAARFAHGGDNEGFKCELVAYQEGGQGAIVMTNGDMGAELKREILHAIAAEYDWPDYLPAARVPVTPPLSLLDAYGGDYELRPGFSLSVRRAGDTLRLHATGQPPLDLLPTSETVFFASVVEAEVDFTRDEQGAVTGLVFRQNSREMSCRKTG